jgi:glucose/arabinose dehydrogenase/mono/diheme cytochrome c family protein
VLGSGCIVKTNNLTSRETLGKLSGVRYVRDFSLAKKEYLAMPLRPSRQFIEPPRPESAAMLLRILFILLIAASPLAAQRGDKRQQQVAPVPSEKIPPAPPLSAEAALKTFKLPAGFRIELVASEPLVEMPVALTFDPDGRIWVVEMRGFMPNLEGKGEEEPVGRVVILEDTDGDGRMDKRTIFLDGLVMPRAVCIVRDGALVGEPPNLWFCRDTDGDGTCDEKTSVASDFGNRKNPEHCASGLLWAQDNWIYSLYHTNRYRNTTGKWERQPTINRVQWGLSQDDFGRLFYTANSDHLRGDLVPSQYVDERGLTNKLTGLGTKIAQDQSVWPIRVTPGVNRAYEPKQLRADGTLATFTAACGTCIYRGDALPADFYGNAFVCEPAANLVRRDVLSEKDGVIVAKNAYHQAEFFASTDERFRPVNVYTGPDGALYIADMYHGIIQHRTYVSSYLHKQIEARGLDRPQNQGRIYRIVHQSKAPGPRPGLRSASVSELVKHLSHPNGWWRDTAQRLLIERADRSVLPALKSVLGNTTNTHARLHALWTLEGLAGLDIATLQTALDDKEPKIRAASIRLAEPFLRNPKLGAGPLLEKILQLKNDLTADVQIQLALTLGELEQNAIIQTALTNLAKSAKFPLAQAAARFSLASRESTKPAAPATPASPASPPGQQRQFEAGKAVYETTCFACHQPHGLGQEGLAPPLVGSPWTTGSVQRLVRIVINGMRGPITVNQQIFELDMPSLAVLDDEQIAAVLTYVRHEWGHSASAVDTATVKKIREATANREDAWTEAELLKIE